MRWEEADAETLFQQCARRSNRNAWEEFVRRFGDLIIAVAHRAAQQYGLATTDVANDLVQNTYVRLCDQDGRILRNFRSTGVNSEYGFIKICALSAAKDYFRQQSARKRAYQKTISLNDSYEKAAASTVEKTLTIREIEDTLVRICCGPTAQRDRWVFLLYYRHGYTAREISAITDIGLKCDGVESLISRLTRSLKEILAKGSDA